ncbi:MAG: AarF/UbiB family protein [Acidimicrobiia bacterium]
MTSLPVRAAMSVWCAAEPGLADAVGDWCDDLAGNDPAQHAAAVARPGLLPPLRSIRYVAALQVANAQWAAGQLSSPGLRPIRHPDAWAKEGIAEILRRQLSLMGPAGAEVARIIASSEGLLPQVVVDELQRHPVRMRRFSGATAEMLARAEFGDRVSQLSDRPVTATPMAQLHAAVLDGDRPVSVWVRRPGIRRTARADARITASIVAAIEALVPAAGDLHPLGFVELAARQALQEADLRQAALNAIELALALEDIGAEGIHVARPLPGLVTRRALVQEDLPGARPFDHAAEMLPPDEAVASWLAAGLEAGLAAGVFHADLRPEHLVVLPDRRLAVVGTGAVGRFDLRMRHSAFAFLIALLSGDHAGAVAAMRDAGAVPPGADEAALVAELATTPSLSPMTMLSTEGGLTGALSDAVGVLLRHRLRPPVEVVLFVRNVFGFRSFLATVAPETTMMAALMPLVQRLPDLHARLAAEPA